MSCMSMTRITSLTWFQVRWRLLATNKGLRASELFFQVFGLIHGIVATLGFAAADRLILGMMANNLADA